MGVVGRSHKVPLVQSAVKIPTPKVRGYNGPSGNGQYNLQNLRGKHRIIIRMHISGLKNLEIADSLGISEAMVSYTLNSPLARQQMAILQGQADLTSIDVLQEAMGLAPVAMEVYEQIMLSPGAKDSDRKSAADSVMEIAGHRGRRTVDVNHRVVTDDYILEAKRRARERAGASGMLVDAEDAVVVEETETAGDGQSREVDIAGIITKDLVKDTEGEE